MASQIEIFLVVGGVQLLGHLVNFTTWSTMPPVVGNILLIGTASSGEPAGLDLGYCPTGKPILAWVPPICQHFFPEHTKNAETVEK
jgi:hypothetical protein